MKSGSWSSYQAALPSEARAGGERDDEPEAVEVVAGPCLGCGKTIRYPVTAEGDDCCCSPECVKTVCDRLDAEIEAMRAADAAEREAALVDGPCGNCGRACRAMPQDFQTGTAFCSTDCERAKAAEVWGSAENPLDDEIPY